LRRPLALFFFPKPPEEEKIERSLRVIEDIPLFSPSIRFLFRKAKAFQMSLEELWSEEIEDHKKRIGWISSLQRGDVLSLAKETRKWLNVSLEEQKSWKNSDLALKKWREALARKGIYVFKEAFRENNEVARFCIYDDLFPIIFINNSMAKNRQIFTLAHELAHIILKESYLDIFDKKFWQLESEQSAHIEVQCNAFASEFLVPQEDLKSSEHSIITEDVIAELAKVYSVSKEVILRCFLNFQAIDKNFYQSKILEWHQNFVSERKNTSGKPSAGGDYYNSKMDYLGRDYLALVLKGFDSGRITLEEVALHLDIKMKGVPIIEEKFLSREAEDVRF
jgi:Zn-dependent peptidase ImmA (M78 family)